MEEQGAIPRLTEAIHRFSDVADKLEKLAPGNSGIQSDIRITGMGSFWNGLAIGVAVGVAVVCASWVAFTLGSLQDDQRQDDAFIQATYQQVPAMREHFNRIQQEQSNEQRPDPN